MNKRNFLKVLGGGTVLAATGLGYKVTQSPDRETMPWENPGSNETDAVKIALSYAILAPNPHNRQPWVVDLSVANQFVLLVDNSRLLPHTDPFQRQITIGLGCFIELFELAMREQGYRSKIEYFPDGDNIYSDTSVPVLRASVEKDGSIKPDPLFLHVLNRRSNTEPYNMGQPVFTDVLDSLIRPAQTNFVTGDSGEESSIRMLRALTREALIVEIETPRTYRESVDHFRIGKTEVEQNPDGIDFSGPLFESLHLFNQFSRALALDKSSSAFEQGMAAVLANTDTAMGHIWINTKENIRIDQLNAGRE